MGAVSKQGFGGSEGVCASQQPREKHLQVEVTVCARWWSKSAFEGLRGSAEESALLPEAAATGKVSAGAWTELSSWQEEKDGSGGRT